jgi:glutaredoxin
MGRWPGETRDNMMKTKATLARCAPLGLALMLCAAGAGAQVYKWTDAKGVVSFSDQPPPANARKVERKSLDAATRAELPYGLAQAAKTNPVVLYTTAPCEACDRGRALLRQRGIPFAEKTVQSNEDQQKLKDAGGDGQLPLLLVGSNKRIGFEAGAWNAALTDAAYPLQRQLPANWQSPEVVSAAPATPQPRPLARNVERDERAAPAKPVKPPSDAPPGFQF